MRITAIPYTLQFKRPAMTSRGALHARPVVFLRAGSDGVIGWGECGPVPGLSPDDRPDFPDVVQSVCDRINADAPTETIDLSGLPSLAFGLETALRDSPALRRELQRWEALNGQLSRFRLRDPGDAVLEDLERSVMARTSLHLGWLLLGGGALLLFAFAVQAVLRDAALPLIFRFSAGGLLLGLALLFGLKVRERWIERRHDPYRYVVR